MAVRQSHLGAFLGCEHYPNCRGTAPLPNASDPAHELLEPTVRTPMWAWGICWLMFASTVLNYLDRQAISLVGEQIKGEFRIRNEEFGWVLSAFYLSYAISQVMAGYLVDRWNTRFAYAAAVTWWSLAGMATAYVPGLGAIKACRGLLGVGEAFNWPCALRVTAKILPPSARSLGNGIFNSGAAVGAVIAPLVITRLTADFGWRSAFVVVASLGFVWVVAWLVLLGGKRALLFAGRETSKPVPVDALSGEETRSGLSPMARTVFGGLAACSVLLAGSGYWFGPSKVWWGIALFMVGLLVAASVLPLSMLKGTDWSESLGEIVRFRRFWALVVGFVSINICWIFLVNWLPTYLQTDRGMKYLTSGFYAALPFLAADLGNLGGGAVAWLLTFRKISPERARFMVMGVCPLLITCGVGVPRIPNDTLMIIVLCLMAMGTAAFMANGFAFCQEVSARHTGFIVGILGGLGNLAGAGFLPFAGGVKDRTGGFGPVFLIVGLVPWVGLAAIAWGWRPPKTS
jgi:MFS transporter, ACS family, hexuronate transporter